MTGQIIDSATAGPDIRPVDHRADPDAPEYRYPGAPPFRDTDVDRLLFRGRQQEIDHVLHSILSVDLFLVYAVSGVGKTSLITAGVLEPLRQRQYFPVMLRLNDPTISPVELVYAQITEAALQSNGITVTWHPLARDEPPTNLWDLLCGLEVWRGNTLQRLVLFFDQFEELFTLDWSDQQRSQFIEQFGQVLRRQRPEQLGQEEDGLAVLPPPNAKVTLIIREDFLGELETLARHVPQIMLHRFRLDGLSPDQAEAALREPGQVSDPRLASECFTYTEGAAQTILHFLRARVERGRPVELGTVDPSQLQIICQHIERTILPRKRQPGGDAVLEITEGDLGGQSGLDRVLRDFYRRELMRLPRRDRRRVRKLCESGFISQSRRRVSLEESDIETRFKVSRTTLQDLVARRLLRAEPRVGSVYYELAHDTLTAPILDHRDDMRRRRRRVWLAASVAVAAAGAGALLIESLHNDKREPSGEVLSAPKGDGDLVVGTPMKGSITQQSTAVFDVDLPTDRSVVVSVDPDADLDILLAVTDEDSRSSFAEDGANGEVEAVVVPASEGGPHRISIVAKGATSGSFELSVRRVDVELAVGDSPAGAISQENPIAVFEVDLPPESQAVVVQVVPDDNLDAVLTLTGSGGLDRRVDTGLNGVAEGVVVPTSEAGSHQVTIRSFDGSSGGFELSVRPVDAELAVGEATTGAIGEESSVAGPADAKLAVGEATTGAIGEESSMAFFAVDLPAGQAVVVELIPDENLDADLEVTDLMGRSRWAAAGLSGEAEAVVVPASEAGSHQVTIRSFDGSSGGFALSVRPLDAELAVGEATTGAIGEESSVAAFAVDVPAGQAVVVEVVPDDDLDAVLVVTDSVGRFQFADSGFSGEAEAVVVPSSEAGSHQVTIRSSDGSSGGFALSVRPLDAELAVGEATTGAIGEESPVAVSAVDVPAGQAVVVEVVPDDDLDALLLVTDSVGRFQFADSGFSGEAEAVVVPSSEAGSQQITVRGFGESAGGFELSVRPVEVAQVAVGESTTGSISTDAPEAVFAVDVPEDQAVVVEVVPAVDLDAVLTVTNPLGLGAQAADVGGYGEADAIAVPASEAGSQQIIVRGFGGSASGFELSVRPVEVAQVAVGESTTGSISTDASVAVFAVDVPEGQAVVVEVVPDENLDAFVVATDLVGRSRWSVAGPNGEAEAVVVPASEAGLHQVTVRGFGGSAGGFELSVRPIDVMALAVGESKAGSISEEVPVSAFAVDLPAGQAGVVEVVPDETLDAALEVTDVMGRSRWAVAGLDGATEAVVVPASEAGSHQITVRGFGGSSGDFELSVRPVEVVLLTVGESGAGSISEEASVAAFAVDVPAGQAVVIEVVPDDNFDAILTVTDSQLLPSRVADANGNGGAEAVVVPTSQEGSHQTIAVTGGTSSGGFGVTVRPVDPLVLTVGRATAGSVSEGISVAAFAVDLLDGQAVAVEVAPDDNLDAAITVTGPNGFDTRGDAGVNGEAEVVVVEGQVGSHLVVVTGVGSTAGGYALMVRPQ